MSSFLKYRYTLDEIKVASDGYECGTECLFKFNFQEQSTSYRACVMNNVTTVTANGEPNLGLPCIKITNEFLSNTNNPGVIAVNFQNNNYWFDSLYVTRPGYRFFNYTNSIYPAPLGVDGSVDASGSSLILVCKTNRDNNLIIQQNIISRVTPPSNSGGSELSNIINYIANEDSSFNDVLCGTKTLSLSRININNFISTSTPYFYYSKTNGGKTYDYIIFSALNPIIISDTVKDNLNNFFPSSSVSISLTQASLPTSSARVFKSSQNPVNNLSEGEDNIYIQCQPTDQEGNILVSGQSVAPQQDLLDLNNMMGENKNMFTAALMGIVIMIIIIKGGEFLLKSGTRTFLGKL